MDVLVLLVPLALLMVGGAVWAFQWAARDGQFDDLVSPAARILDDDGSDRDPPDERSDDPDRSR